ncbi:hypothetical protein COOONC_21876 [Cooperia oncophora]
MHIVLNPRALIPPESAAGKQNAATQASAGAKPIGSVPPAAKAVSSRSPTTPSPAAAVAAKPAAAVQPHPNTATPATQAVKGAATPGNGAAPSAPKLHQTSSTKGNKPPAAPPRIQLEKETKEQILAAIMEPPGEDDNSSLISIQPSQSEVNIDVQKKLQDSPVVKAFAEAEKKKSSQH